MREIVLRQSIVTLVDDDVYEEVSQFHWTWSQIRYRKYVSRIVRANGKKTYYYLHRVITGAVKGQFVDHINGDTLDNRRGNLRLCTQAQNAWNRGTTKHNTHGYKGVVFHSFSNLWLARITVNKKIIYLGYSHTPKEAARLYDAAALKHHGEYAKTNAMLGLL